VLSSVYALQPSDLPKSASLETAQRDSLTPAFSSASPKIIPVHGAGEVDGVFRLHFRAAERPGSAAGADPPPTADGSTALQCAAVPRLLQPLVRRGYTLPAIKRSRLKPGKPL